VYESEGVVCWWCGVCILMGKRAFVRLLCSGVFFSFLAFVVVVVRLFVWRYVCKRSESERGEEETELQYS
jgi:membrane protein implicated in regulation of membrane protease activity